MEMVHEFQDIAVHVSADGNVVDQTEVNLHENISEGLPTLLYGINAKENVRYTTQSQEELE